MAYRIRKQFKSGRIVETKVDRRWMYDTIQRQQEVINQMAQYIQDLRGALSNYVQMAKAAKEQKMSELENIELTVHPEEGK